MKASEKPFLIALEGPAGVGKTALQHFICEELVSRGINAAALPEFSSSLLGELLERHAAYGEAKPSWSVELGGLLAYVADKVSLVEGIIGLPRDIFISDRFLSSQLILGVREITGQLERRLATKIISQTMEWAAQQFAENSVLVFLEAPVEMLAERLEQRLGATLLQTQRTLLDDEIREYRSLDFSLPRFKQVRVDATPPIEIVANQIISLIPHNGQTR